MRILSVYKVINTKKHSNNNLWIAMLWVYYTQNYRLPTRFQRSKRYTDPSSWGWDIQQNVHKKAQPNQTIAVSKFLETCKRLCKDLLQTFKIFFRNMWDTCKKPAGKMQPFVPVVCLTIFGILIHMVINIPKRNRNSLGNNSYKKFPFFLLP